MPCMICNKFPVPTSNFREIGVSEDRHGTLYQCKQCQTYIEVIAEERAPRFTAIEELKKYYKELNS